MKLNLTEHREDEIEFHAFENVNNIYTFYYDETNNIRKLKLTEDGKFNIPANQISQNFVLGGILYEAKPELNIRQLKKDLYLDVNNNEMKFKHIARGSFIDCLKSEKLHTFLKWVGNNNLYVHYSTIDILYWSLVDIIDSSVIYYKNFNYEHIYYFKALLYEVAKNDLERFLNILSHYNYPNIKKDKNFFFLKQLISYIKDNEEFIIKSIPLFSKESCIILVEILKSAQNKELTFIENNIDLELIDTFSHFYKRPIGLFNKSKHIFDEERQVINFFKQFEFYDNKEKMNNYSFHESNKYELIQVSDVMVGLLGKFFAFINELEYENIIEVNNQLNILQKENLVLLLKLLVQSEEQSKAFVHHISPITHIEKALLLTQEFII